MDSLTLDQRALVAEIVAALDEVPGVAAIVLGGSHARGRARADSDIDLGLYYSEADPFSIDAVRAIAERFHDAPAPVVTDFFEWGPWANGGAWLTVRGQRVDLIYRSLEHTQRVIEDAHAGRYEIHWAQQPPFGFFGPTYLGEVEIAVPLRDPHGHVAALKERVAPYPEALRRSVVQERLWAVEFGLAGFAKKYAARGDVYGTTGCLVRFANQLVLALFALNRTYPLGDKDAIAEASLFAQSPAHFRERTEAILAKPGESVEQLGESVAALETIFRETAVLAGSLYRPNALP